MTKEQKNISIPGVLMFMGSRCSYCGPMIQILTELMKAGQLADLRVINIEKKPEMAARFGVRSVPWLQIGPFELHGARNRKELELWMERASRSEGITDYIEEVLAEGKIEAVEKLLKSKPEVLNNVIELMGNPNAKINVRLGVGVIIENMAETEDFKIVIPRLLEYLSSEDARVRGDACHYLSLTRNSDFIPHIEKLLSDDSEEVREIAQDSLDELRNEA
jgi:hypothetical protein